MINRLKEFLTSKMKMSGPYQPVIIKCLLANNGEADLDTIAKELAANDPEAIEYYKGKLKIYPKEVLKSHSIATLNKGTFRLAEDLMGSLVNKDELITIAELKAQEYYTKNPFSDFARHGWGSLRHRMITEHPKCSLCGGTPANGIMLDIDHIVPVTRGELMIHLIYRFYAIDVIGVRAMRL